MAKKVQLFVNKNNVAEILAKTEKTKEKAEQDNLSVFIPELPKLQQKKENNEIFTNNDIKQTETNKEKNKKILIGVSIGLAALAVGLAIIDWRRPNSILKNLLKKGALQTKIGREINDGINFAKEAKEIPMETIQSESGNIFGKIFGKVSHDGGKICQDITGDKAFVERSIELVGDKIVDNPLLVSQLEHAEKASDAIQRAIELSGTGPTKMAQIISSETEIMANIEKHAPELADALRSTKSNCSFSRTFEQAAEFLEKAFPGKGYVLEQELSAGSIGATYLAKKPDGTQVVIKMIKNGVSTESLKAEQSFFENLISKVVGSAEEAENMRKMSKELYADWMGELNLFQSMKNNAAFADGATRFSVAKITEVASNGQCLVMDMAKGIQMNELIKILKDYKLNPAEFSTKYAKLIEINPWLAKPDIVMENLSSTILRAFDEQFLFVKKGAKNIMHGDPHTGNFFVTANKHGKLMLEFIDTDNCIIRNSAEIKRDLKMIANYCVGNEEKVAEYFVNMCKCNPSSKEVLTKEIAADIRKYIFGRKTSITDLETFLDNMKIILKKHGLNLSGNSTSLKAQIQYLSVATEAAKLSGKNLNIFTVVRDIPQALLCMLKAGINPFCCISDAVKYASHNVKSALGASLQFIAA